MNATGYPGADWVEVGRGEATELEKGLFERSVLNTVRYADPAAWTIATAAARAIAPLREQVATLRDEIGMVATATHGPEEATAAVAEAARAGFPSALRYPAVNPGSLVGVSCIALGFHGPTLCLLNAPEQGVPAALFVASRWLRRGAARLMLVAVYTRPATGRRLARVAVLAPPAPEDGMWAAAAPPTMEWLGGATAGTQA